MRLAWRLLEHDTAPFAATVDKPFLYQKSFNEESMYLPVGVKSNCSTSTPSRVVKHQKPKVPLGQSSTASMLRLLDCAGQVPGGDKVPWVPIDDAPGSLASRTSYSWRTII